MAKEKIILCDSNIIIDFLRGKEKTKNVLKDIGKDNIGISIITKAEILNGAHKRDFSKTKQLLDSFNLYHINENISKEFNGIFLNYATDRLLGIPDALIAATSIQYNLELYTHNKRDFDFIPEIKFYHPK